jgi:hypothetical protein
VPHSPQLLRSTAVLTHWPAHSTVPSPHPGGLDVRGAGGGPEPHERGDERDEAERSFESFQAQRHADPRREEGPRGYRRACIDRNFRPADERDARRAQTRASAS